MAGEKISEQTEEVSPASDDLVLIEKGSGSSAGKNRKVQVSNLGGSGSGVGGINYITNFDFESGMDDWSAYADAAAASPFDGTGGTPNVTFTQETTDPLRGVGSGRLTKDAANRQGEGVSIDFTIDDADKDGKRLSIKMDYLGSANFAAADVAVFIYDVTNAALVPVQFNDLEIQGAVGFLETSFLTTDSTSYRLIIHIASTNAAAWTLDIDTVLVGPRTSTVSGDPFPIVIAEAHATAATSLPNATATVVDWNVVDKDTHGAITTGASWKFTAPTRGRYKVEAFNQLDQTSFSLGQRVLLEVYKNGSVVEIIALHRADAAGTFNTEVGGGTEVDLDAGDTMDLRINQDSGGAVNSGSSRTTAHVKIRRVPDQDTPAGPRAPHTTEPLAFTPTSNVTNATHKGKWSREGDFLRGQIGLEFTGTPGAVGNFEFDMPFGLTVDEDKLPMGSGEDSIIGYGTLVKASATSRLFPVVVQWDSGSQKIQLITAESGNLSVVDESVPFTWGSGDRLTMNFRVPITNWGLGGGGVFESPWVGYTPTFTNGVTLGTGGSSEWRYRWNGSDSIDLVGRIVLGTGGSLGAGTFLVQLPAGLEFDADKLAGSDASGTDARLIGKGEVFDNNASAGWDGTPFRSGTSVDEIAIVIIGQGVALQTVSNTAPFTFADSDEIVVNIAGSPVKRA